MPVKNLSTAFNEQERRDSAQGLVKKQAFSSDAKQNVEQAQEVVKHLLDHAADVNSFADEQSFMAADAKTAKALDAENSLAAEEEVDNNALVIAAARYKTIESPLFGLDGLEDPEADEDESKALEGEQQASAQEPKASASTKAKKDSSSTHKASKSSTKDAAKGKTHSLESLIEYEDGEEEVLSSSISASADADVLSSAQAHASVNASDSATFDTEVKAPKAKSTAAKTKASTSKSKAKAKDKATLEPSVLTDAHADNAHADEFISAAQEATSTDTKPKTKRKSKAKAQPSSNDGEGFDELALFAGDSVSSVNESSAASNINNVSNAANNESNVASTLNNESSAASSVHNVSNAANNEGKTANNSSNAASPMQDEEDVPPFGFLEDEADDFFNQASSSYNPADDDSYADSFSEEAMSELFAEAPQEQVEGYYGSSMPDNEDLAKYDAGAPVPLKPNNNAQDSGSVPSAASYSLAKSSFNGANALSASAQASGSNSAPKAAISSGFANEPNAAQSASSLSNNYSDEPSKSNQHFEDDFAGDFDDQAAHNSNASMDLFDQALENNARELDARELNESRSHIEDTSADDMSSANFWNFQEEIEPQVFEQLRQEFREHQRYLKAKNLRKLKREVSEAQAVADAARKATASGAMEAYAGAGSITSFFSTRFDQNKHVEANKLGEDNNGSSPSTEAANLTASHGTESNVATSNASNLAAASLSAEASLDGSSTSVIGYAGGREPEGYTNYTYGFEKLAPEDLGRNLVYKVLNITPSSTNEERDEARFYLTQLDYKLEDIFGDRGYFSPCDPVVSHKWQVNSKAWAQEDLKIKSELFEQDSQDFKEAFADELEAQAFALTYSNDGFMPRYGYFARDKSTGRLLELGRIIYTRAWECRKFDRVNLTFVDYILKRFPMANGIDREQFAIVLLCLFFKMQNGDSCINLNDMRSLIEVFDEWGEWEQDARYSEHDLSYTRFMAAVKYFYPSSPDILIKLLSKNLAVGSMDEQNCPLIFKDGRIYSRRYFNYELYIAQYIGACGDYDISPEMLAKLKSAIEILFAPRDGDSSAKLAANANSSSDTATKKIDWQKIAALMACKSKFTVISGGPGTGKTTTVLRIIILLICMHKDSRNIHMCAPTGKAAARMGESIANQLKDPRTAEQLEKIAKIFGIDVATIKQYIPHDAKTVHSTIGISLKNSTPVFNEEMPLNCDVLIVDEVSMLDVALFSKLLKSLNKKCKIIMLGDKDQLASVEAGAVLAEICASLERTDNGRIASETLDYLESMSGYPREQILQDKIADHVCLLKDSYRFKDEPFIGKLATLVNENPHGEVDEQNKLTRAQNLAEAASNESDQMLEDEIIKNASELAKMRAPKLVSPIGQRKYDEMLKLFDEAKLKHPDNTPIVKDIYLLDSAVDKKMQVLTNSLTKKEHLSIMRTFNEVAYQAVQRGRDDNYAPFLERLESMNYIVKNDVKELSDLFALMDRYRILCSNHSGTMGDRELNAQIEREVKKEYLKGLKFKNSKFFPGQIISITKNDSMTGLVNGYVGFVAYEDLDFAQAKQNGYEYKKISQGSNDGNTSSKDQSDKDVLRIFIPIGVQEVNGQTVPKFTVVNTMMLNDYELGYAMSIHKSQGSEYKRVSIILAEKPNRVLTKELVYTGITRAKSKVHLVSSDLSLKYALSNSVDRESGLALSIAQETLKRKEQERKHD